MRNKSRNKGTIILGELKTVGIECGNKKVMWSDSLLVPWTLPTHISKVNKWSVELQDVSKKEQLIYNKEQREMKKVGRLE